MFFSVISKNLNWEILTKNLVTFRRWDRVKDEYCGGSLKNLIFRGAGVTKNQYIRGLFKKGAWIVCRFKTKFGEKEEGDVFEGEGVDTPMHTMACLPMPKLA